MVKDIKGDLIANMEHPDEETVQKIKSYLGNRWRLKIGFFDNFKFIFNKILRFICGCCISKKDARSMENIDERKVELFMKGESKIKNELDCVSILTKLRYLDVIVSLFLNSNQKLLLGFQRKNVIQEDTGNMTSDDDQETTKDFIRKLDFNDPGAANILNEERLDDALESFHHKRLLSNLDQKILLGIVSRAPNKYTDLDPSEKDDLIQDSSSSACSSPNPEEIEHKRVEKFMQSSASRMSKIGGKKSEYLRKSSTDEVSHNNMDNHGCSTSQSANASGIIPLKSKGAKNQAPQMNKQFAGVSA